MAEIITGERVSTREGGHNATWQRHVAAYRFAEGFLGPGRVLDVGAGVGHSYALLAPRETIGIDLDAGALEGQERETHVADMRDLPFENASFGGVVTVQSIEHVPSGERAIAEARRVLEAGGVAVYVTPNRLTFARPDEIIDPFHYVEYDADQLAALCGTSFREVEIWGIFGSERYLAIVNDRLAELDDLLKKDPLKLRRLVPRPAKQWFYDWRISKDRRPPDPRSDEITVDDFSPGREPIASALDLVAVCR